MPSLFENVRQLMSWTSRGTLETADLTRSYTWSQGQALSPILPPTMPGAAVTVADALKCPPVARAVGLYSAAMLRLEWAAAPNVLDWLTRASGPVSAKVRDVRTLTDLALVNRALWITTGTGTARQEAVHLPADLWSLDERGLVLIGGVAPDASGAYVLQGKTVTTVDNLVYFPGAMPLPFLDAAADTLTHYKDITATIKSRGRSPIALMELEVLDSYDGPVPGDEDYVEAEDLILNTQKNYAKARRDPDGVVTVTPQGVKLNIHQAADDAAMLLQARNAVRLDVANFLNINAAMLDGNNGTTDTYSNTLQNRNEFLDLSLALFTGPMTERLSLDDVTPQGQAVTLPLDAWDTTDTAAGNTGQAVGNLQAGPAAG